MPEAGPLGETRFEASVRAIVAASFLNSPSGGCVESVVTVFTQRREVDFFAMVDGAAGDAPVRPAPCAGCLPEKD